MGEQTSAGWISRLRLGAWCRFWLGLATGLVGLCVVIEIVRGIYSHGWEHAFVAVVEYVGRFTWLAEFQTFLTGVAAVAAAAYSIREIRRQIRKSDQAARRQIDHEKAMEAARVSAKRAAARAVLPLALAEISDFAERTGEALRDVHGLCAGGILPGGAILPPIPTLPKDIIDPIKEMIELLEPGNRNFLWQMLVRIQVLQSRLSGMIQSHTRPGSFVTESNVEAYILDACEIYARSSGTYKFARGVHDNLPEKLIHKDIATALHQVGIFDALYDDLVRKYDLTSNKKWGERWGG